MSVGGRSGQVPDEAAVGRTIHILHFNDVYNIEGGADSGDDTALSGAGAGTGAGAEEPEQGEEREPLAGAARFASAINAHRHLEPLILFSGDVFSPSIMSTYTQGKQMIPVLNRIGVHLACYGNHDFDFGVDTLIDSAKQTTFPWLMSNVIDNETGQLLADGQQTHVLTWGGVKIGFVGLVEEEWLDTLACVNPDDVTYLDFVQEGRKLATKLKLDHECEYVIALTHMRTPNDLKLGEEVEEIDLILGGHDHTYEIHKLPGGRYMIKSGTDFRQLSRISLHFPSESPCAGGDSSHPPKIQVHEITIDGSWREDPDMKEIVNKYQADCEKQLDTVLGVFAVDLDGRFPIIRTQETNLGNFITDVMREACHADIALLNSGAIRSDTVHKKGPFTMRDLGSIIPMVNTMTVLKLYGFQVIEALENGVSQYPKLEGRFPQVSGVSFTFNPNNKPGERINPWFVKVGEYYLELDKEYSVVTKSYLAEGKDGYDVFKSAEVLMDEEQCPVINVIIQNHFHSIKVVKGIEKAKHKHRQSLYYQTRRNSIYRYDSNRNSGRSSARGSITSAGKGIIPLDNLLRIYRQRKISACSSLEVPGFISPTPSMGDGLYSRESSATSFSSLSEHYKFHDMYKNDSLASLNSKYSRQSSYSGGTCEGCEQCAGGEKHQIRRRRSRVKRPKTPAELENEQCQLAPKVEGRIQVLSPQLEDELLSERAQFEEMWSDEMMCGGGTPSSPEPGTTAGAGCGGAPVSPGPPPPLVTVSGVRLTPGGDSLHSTSSPDVSPGSPGATGCGSPAVFR